MTDTAFFGFFIFVMLRPYIVDFSLIPLAAGLLGFRLFNMFFLRRSVTIGLFAGVNAVLGTALVVFSMRLLTLSPFQLLPAAICAGALAVLVLRSVYFSVSRSAKPLSAVTVDLLFLLILIASIWQNYSAVPGLPAMMAFLFWALAWGIADLAFQHIPVSQKQAGTGRPALVVAMTAAFFILVSLAAAAVGKNVSNGLVGAFLAVLSAIVNAVRYVLHLLEAGLVFLFSLFPATPGEYAEPYEMPEDFMVKMQEQAEASDPRGLMVFLAVLLAAAVCFLIYWIIKKRVLHWRIPVRPTVKASRRAIVSGSGSMRLVFRRIAVFFHSIFLLLFFPGQIPSLLIRADWYGKRHFHPRRRGETLREYLNRLCETADEEKRKELEPGAVLLARYADQYLYGEKAVQPEKNEVLAIRKAFPLAHG